MSRKSERQYSNKKQKTSVNINVLVELKHKDLMRFGLKHPTVLKFKATFIVHNSLWKTVKSQDKNIFQSRKQI